MNTKTKCDDDVTDEKLKVGWKGRGRFRREESFIDVFLLVRVSWNLREAANSIEADLQC